MSRSLLALIALLGSSGAASAAPYDWSGFYVGFGLGSTVSIPALGTTTSGTAPLSFSLDTSPKSLSDGLKLDFEAGYNFTFDSGLLLGVQGSVGGLGSTAGN